MNTYTLTEVQRQQLLDLFKRASEAGYSIECEPSDAMLQSLTPNSGEAVAYEHHEYRPMGGPGGIRIHCVMSSEYTLPDGSISDDFQWLIDNYKQSKTTIKLLPLFTHPAPSTSLTEAQVTAAIDKWFSREFEYNYSMETRMRAAIESALAIKGGA